MEILIGQYSGFCQGVCYTVKKALDTVSVNDNVYCLGEIVHNERVIKDLEDKGMITVSSLDEVPNNAKVIFRAHGEQIKIYDEAKKKNLEVIDLTCGKIRIIRNKIIKQKDNSFIIIIGKKNHPETIGTFSYAGENASIIESEEDIINSLELVGNSHLKRIYVCAQTTFSSKLFDLYIDRLKELFDGEVIFDKTICDATENRQNEVRELSYSVDKMIIVGGMKSSNTKELYLIAKEILDDVYLIQDINDIKDITFSSNDIIGIMAGASTPDDVVLEIVDYLNKFK